MKPVVCPQCGAGLTVPGSGNDNIRCDYCGVVSTHDWKPSDHRSISREELELARIRTSLETARNQLALLEDELDKPASDYIDMQLQRPSPPLFRATHREAKFAVPTFTWILVAVASILTLVSIVGFDTLHDYEINWASVVFAKGGGICGAFLVLSVAIIIKRLCGEIVSFFRPSEKVDEAAKIESERISYQQQLIDYTKRLEEAKQQAFRLKAENDTRARLEIEVLRRQIAELETQEKLLAKGMA